MRLIAPTIRAAALTALTALAARTLPAQDRTPDRAREDAERERRRVTVWSPGDDDARIYFSGDDAASRRAVLGISTSSSGERDTLGLLITAVTAGGPAERARLEEGNRIAAINGTNLRLAPADAGEPDMQGLAARRLTRELSKVRPGAEVELRVWQGGRYQTVRVRTVAADSLPGRRLAVRGRTRVERERDRAELTREREARPVLGLELQATGSRRDTLGVLVTRVSEGGPAERAGLVEGDRVAAVNGVDLRVSRDDAGDSWVSSAKSSRFSREMQRARVGTPVELRVYSSGQYKTVRVTPARAGDVYKETRNGVFSRSAFLDADVVMPPPIPPAAPVAPVPPVPPTPPMTPMAPMAPLAPDVDVYIDRGEIRARVDDAMRRAFDRMELRGPALRGRVHRI